MIVNKKFQSWIGKRFESSNAMEENCEIGLVKNWNSVFLMSDGIPECVYGKLTITNDEIKNEILKRENSEKFVTSLSNKAMSQGGEDNIALIGLKNNI